jgi:hypothetical protein
MRLLPPALLALAFLFVPAAALASSGQAATRVETSWHVQSSWQHTHTASHQTVVYTTVSDCGRRCGQTDRRARRSDRHARRSDRYARHGSHQAQPAPVVYAMAEADFAYLLARVRAETFSSDKVRVVHTAADWHWFSSDQVRRLLGAFTFSSDKMRVLERVAPNIVDPQNGYLIYAELTFSSDKRRAEEILRAAR